jgi:hypothetical protein
MPSGIKFSTEYIDVLKNLLKVSKGAKKNEILFFKKDGTPMISLMDMGALVHLKTNEQHASFDIDEFGVANIGEFMDYVKAINYPSVGDISIATETSTKGKTFECVVLNDDYVKYRMIVADPTKFEEKKDKKVPISRDKDPMELVASFIVTQDDLNQLTNDIKLMKGCEFFGITVNNDVSFYMRGIERQQVTRKVDPVICKINNTQILASDGIDKFRQFPARIFNFMSYFKIDFEVEIRYTGENRNLVGFKAFGKVPVDGKGDIEVFIGATESTSQSQNNYDVIE